jgi:hypothetical protein
MQAKIPELIGMIKFSQRLFCIFIKVPYCVIKIEKKDVYMASKLISKIMLQING